MSDSMSNTLASHEYETELDLVADAVSRKRLSTAAAANIRDWLTEARYRQYADQVVDHIRAGKWQQLDDVFWTVIPFGTGGRRGKMYPIGSNAINDRTIGESAQGLADYVKQIVGDTGLSCAIAYDTRHQSRHFAELCAEVLAANGFKIWFLDGYRSTPELSFAVRYKHCSCGLMVTASHNPPSDNAVKAYWSTGGQLLPPHDRGVIERVMSVEEIARVPFAEALADGRVQYCQLEVDAEYIRQVRLQSLPGPRQIKILYSPMHGVGASSVVPALTAVGFGNVEIFGPHADPNGDFPNIPEHVANPENPATFDSLIERAKQTGADLVLSTDPDADRLGCATPRKVGGGDWHVLTGNQIGALLAEHMLEGRKYAGNLSPKHYLVKTLVTTELIRRIGDSYGVTTYGDLQVGFKWIGGMMDEMGPDLFLLGCEESHGFLAGQYARDKDAAVAALMLAEFAARARAAGQTLFEKLDALFWQHGCHAERTVSKTMPGSEGMARMQKLMAGLRRSPPKSLAGIKVRQTRDYLEQVVIRSTGRQPLDGAKGDTLIFDLATEGNYVAVRPSGTEPKVKFYLFTYEPPELLADLDETKRLLAQRLAALDADLVRLADEVE
jgi:phosphomannomutase